MDSEDRQGPGPGPAATPETETVRGWPGEPPEVRVPEPEPLARGTQVGRYVLLDAVGSGGMGVVYAAYDPELDRKVAIKLLRFDRLGSEAGDRDRLRLQREAQAIARLSHPNVVHVYDVGTFGDQVFVAMEFVAGRTLRRWAEEAARPWREVVDRFVLAGRGLAAAHAAGLVHRDFKPDNVLLGDDGRVRVVDFGLARPTGEEPAPEGERAPASGTLAHPLTEWGVVVGTPAYMAPEQLRGEAADERSDQFSFCASLYETLYGERPFTGETVGALAASYARGEAPRPPERVKVPARVRQALLRGLSLTPAARFPSMEELLRELERDGSTSRRRWLAAAAVVLLAAAGLGQWGWSRAQLCRGGEVRLSGAWDSGSRQAGNAAFLASGVPFAAGAWTGVERALDRHIHEWTEMHRAACEATRVRGEQSEELLDRRMVCLDQRLGEVRALAAVFARADAGVVEKSGDAVNRLTPVAVCADTALLSASTPLPADPERRSRIERLQARLAEIKALTDSGQDREALARLGPFLPAVESAAHLPLQAEARFLSGTVLERLGRNQEAEKETFSALLAAQSGGRTDLVAETAGQLSFLGVKQNRLDESERWIQLSRASIDRLEGNGATAARLNNRLATLLVSQGRYEEAVTTFQRAETLAERELGRDNLVSSKALNNRAAILNAMGRAEEALQLALRSNVIQRKLLEPDHPDLSRSYTGLGNIYSTLGRHEEALEMHRKALEIAVARYGEHHDLVAGAYGNLGNAVFDLGRYDEALRYFQRGLAVLEVLSPEGRDTASMLINLGNTLNELKRHGEALPLHQRAVALQEKLLPPDHFEHAFGIQGLGVTLHGLGKLQESLALLERSRGILQTAPVPPYLLAMNRFSLAQALWDEGQRERALREARAARDVFAGAGLKLLEDEVEVWLHERGQGSSPPQVKPASPRHG